MSSIGIIDEKSLALRLQKGESGAMRDFYAQYSRMITAICARYIANDDDIKDVVQDSLVNVFSKIGKFQYRGDGSLKAWAARIAVNTSIAMLRKGSRMMTIPLDALSSGESLGEASDQPVTADIPPNVIHEKIRELPDGYRTVFNLYAIDHRSHKEIGEMLGIKADTSASQYLRAKKILARKLNEYINKNDLRQ